MFTNISMTGVGGIVALLIIVAKLFGIEIPDELGGKITEAITVLFDAYLLVWGQLRRKDLVAGIIRK